MRWSQYFLYTLREEPADADVISQRLMMRAAMIRKVAAGIYSYLPAGLRSIHKLEQIVREEMNRAGAIELSMPAIQPAELWMESGRWQVYGKELLRIRDRHDRDFVFGPTHEEVITDIVRDTVSSWRQLPTNLYQIQTKFRDEVRPRFGLMRGREFIMKDAYSFHSSWESLNETYEKMREAYTRIFERCGLEHIVVEADTGNIGGSASHEFMVLAQSGEDVVVRCPQCGYGANVEKAEMASPLEPESPDEMQPLGEVNTPGITTIEQLSGFLEVPPSRIAKSLLLQTDKEVVMVLLPGDRAANEVKIRNALQAEWIAMADGATIERVTGGPEGFSGPLGVEGIRVLADVNLKTMRNFVTGANRSDLHQRNVNLGRDFSPVLFGDFTVVGEADPCPRCRAALQMYRGIEVGHIFKLGTKYSAAMHCEFLDERGDRQPMIMGCYGLGIGRTVAAAIEQNHDADGIIWPVPLAPFEVVVTAVGPDEKVREVAVSIYEELRASAIDVLLDDRDERPGVKFKDTDLFGFPWRITVGSRSLAQGQVEWSDRRTREKKTSAPEAVSAEVAARVKAERT
ncbi:MAG TPA: proline--tRNA ligase [Thermoanaerobaculia bacterium]|nr:proline--tRNA ligase [Thermoanaerobaculia bacterium]